MEWRVFVPQSSEVSDERTAVQRERLQEAVQNLRALFGRSGFPETRTDEYIVATKNVGAKFRHGEKLEVKSMVKHFPSGVEHWRKKKFSKKSLATQLDAVMEHLTSVGCHRLDDVHSRLLQESYITVDKQRVNEYIGDSVCLEFCTIDVFGTSIGESRSKHWISFAIESSDPDIIRRFINEHEVVQKFLRELVAVNDGEEQIQSSSFVSILGGYPLFVEYLANLSDPQHIASSLQILKSLV